MPLADIQLDISPDGDGDIQLVDGDLSIVSGDQCIAQALKQRLKLWLAEWFLAEGTGIPYHDEVFIKNPRWITLDALFKAEIMATPGVVELKSFSMELNGATRTLLLRFEVRTENGTTIPFNEQLP